MLTRDTLYARLPTRRFADTLGPSRNELKWGYPVQFSLAYEMQRPTLDDHAVIEETIEQCILADEMGFDAVWFVEHHFLTTFSSSPCPEVIFGALSRLTKNIRLGFGVVILPYHHPIRVAERVAMVLSLIHI